MLNANLVPPRRRRTATVGLATLIALAVALVAWSGTVRAATGSVSIDEGALGAGFVSQNGGAWFSGPCATGFTPFPVGGLEHRFALEFPLTALPADATITGATLSLRTSAPEGAGDTAIYGYAGDGEITDDDVQVSGIPVPITPTTAGREDHDVTALLTPEVLAAGWAGFSLRQEPLGTAFGGWSCPEESLYPILTITYSLPDADADGDGVLDADDLCADTVPDAFPQLQKNRYAANSEGELVSQLKNAPTYTLDDTAGCSASQIIVLADAGAGHERFGLSRSMLEAFIADQ